LWGTGISVSLPPFSLNRINDRFPVWNNHYPVGWAHAMDAPFQWTKQIASHYGGTRNGMVISWSTQIKDTGGIRAQWHHVIDILPTVLDAIGLPQRKRLME
jgi:arylsulfatase A-like enzyme